MAKIGCLLMMVAMIGLCVLVVLPVLPFLERRGPIDRILEPVLCAPGETIERDPYTTAGSRGGTTFTMSVYCLDANEGRRDATDRWIFISMGAFLVPFLVGLFALIAGAQRNARVVTSSPYAVTIEQPTASRSLTQRLKELQEARDAGLLTADEYDRLRREVLDSNT